MLYRVNIAILAALLACGLAAHAEPDGPRWYYMGPWVLDADEGIDFWRAPEHTVGLIDLRGTVGGCGFFSTDVALADPSYVLLGTDLADAVDVADWEAQTGIDVPDGWSGTILDALWNNCTIWADPTGETTCAGLFPTSQKQIELHLGGHSLIKSRRWQADKDPMWPNVQQRMQAAYRIEREQATEAIAKLPSRDRAMAQTKIRAHFERVMGARSLDLGVPWQELAPEDLRDWGSMSPGTSWTDTFTDADTTVLSSHTPDGGGSWTRRFGATPTISSNTLIGTSNSYFRRESDVSGSNNYCSVTVLGGTTGVGCRWQSAAWTLYAGIISKAGSPNTYSCQRITAFSGTALFATAGHDNNYPSTFEVRADGSNISMTDGGGLINLVSDPAGHSTGTRSGIASSSSVAGSMDNHFFSDIPATGPSIPVVMHHRRMQGMSMLMPWRDMDEHLRRVCAPLPEFTPVEYVR